MVRLDKIYTKGGDKGMTSLGDGGRHAKDTPRLHAIGAIDEVSCWIGCVMLHTEKDADHAMLARLLTEIQHDLFDIGADLCQPSSTKKQIPRIDDSYTQRLEAHIDKLNASLSPLTSFILPGGSSLAAHCHLARAVVRRAERHVITLDRAEAINPHILTYLNRLSDMLFVLARHANQQGTSDVLWQPDHARQAKHHEA